MLAVTLYKTIVTYCPTGISKIGNLHLKFVNGLHALSFIYNTAICNNRQYN